MLATVVKHIRTSLYTSYDCSCHICYTFLFCVFLQQSVITIAFFFTDLRHVFFVEVTQAKDTPGLQTDNQGQGTKPWTYKKDYAAWAGIQTLDP